jgi:preprotein translocase subunit SecA
MSLEKLRGGAPRDERLVLRGLYFGIVDEADSAFIDEARTPHSYSSQPRAKSPAVSRHKARLKCDSTQCGSASTAAS